MFFFLKYNLIKIGLIDKSYKMDKNLMILKKTNKSLKCSLIKK